MFFFFFFIFFVVGHELCSCPTNLTNIEGCAQDFFCFSNQINCCQKLNSSRQRCPQNLRFKCNSTPCLAGLNSTTDCCKNDPDECGAAGLQHEDCQCTSFPTVAPTLQYHSRQYSLSKFGENCGYNFIKVRNVTYEECKAVAQTLKTPSFSELIINVDAGPKCFFSNSYWQFSQTESEVIPPNVRVVCKSTTKFPTSLPTLSPTTKEEGTLTTLEKLSNTAKTGEILAIISFVLLVFYYLYIYGKKTGLKKGTLQLLKDIRKTLGKGTSNLATGTEKLATGIGRGTEKFAIEIGHGTEKLANRIGENTITIQTEKLFNSFLNFLQQKKQKEGVFVPPGQHLGQGGATDFRASVSPKGRGKLFFSKVKPNQRTNILGKI